MPPSSAAIWLAESPSDHSFFRSSTRSSVHDMPSSSTVRAQSAGTLCKHTLGRIPHRARKRVAAAQHATQNPDALVNRPPHEMSYLTSKRLQYGASLAQESSVPLPHVPSRCGRGENEPSPRRGFCLLFPLLTARRAPINMNRAAQKRRHILFDRADWQGPKWLGPHGTARQPRTLAVTSHLMTTYSRVDLALER